MVGGRVMAKSLLKIVGAATLALAVTAPAAAQFSASYKFLKAVRDANGDDATKALEGSGSTLVNTRDQTTGDTALHITIGRRDLTWTSFMLGKDANPNVRNNSGDTPLIVAARIGFIEGATLLLSRGASINLPSTSGETALIIAVQQRDLPMVRFLLSKGADPKQADRIAGKSARDYAAEDARASVILKLLDDTPAVAKPKMSGPKL
jgi:ankyrin repeat protein